jgi:hypothetical protein
MSLSVTAATPTLGFTQSTAQRIQRATYTGLDHSEYKTNQSSQNIKLAINSFKKKAKAVPLHATKARGVRRGIAPLILDLGTRWGWLVSGTPRPRFSPGERTPGTHCRGGWVGPRAGLDTDAKGKIPFLCRGSNIDRPVVKPVARLYTD